MAKAIHEFFLRGGFAEARIQEIAHDIGKVAHGQVWAERMNRETVLCIDDPRDIDIVRDRIGNVVDGEADLSR